MKHQHNFYLVAFTYICVLPLVLHCLQNSELMGAFAVGQLGKFKVNQTQVQEQLGHPAAVVRVRFRFECQVRSWR